MPSSTLPSTERLETIEALAFADQYKAAPAEVASALGLGTQWLDGSLIAWASRADVLMFNRAFSIGQTEDATRDQLAAIAARFDAESVPRSFLQIAPGARPAEIEEWAVELGYAPYNRWAKFARALSDLPSVPDSVELHEIGKDRADVFAKLVVETFRMPDFFTAWQVAMVRRLNWKHYIATLDGQPVGCAAMFLSDGLASLGTAGTLASARGRGVQGALIKRRLRDAAAAGCTHAVVETAEDTTEKPAPSFRNQLRHGFELCYYRNNYLRVRPSAPSPEGAS